MGEDRNRWIALIKGLRAEHGVDMFEAEKIAVSRPEWRRWVDKQINSDYQCHRMALRHIRDRGEKSLLDRKGKLLQVR